MADLEDSIAPGHKAEARRIAEDFFTASDLPTARRALRINSITCQDGLRDLLAVAAFPTKPDVLVVPMVESARDISLIERILTPDCPQLDVFAVVETPRGLDNVAEIAASSHWLRALVFGSADYSFAVGARLSWEALVHARARLVNSARAAGIEAMDSPSFQVDDISRLRHEAELARDLGFSGKVAIHPRQIPVINETFSPDSATIERARRIVAAGQATAQDVSVVDGAMVGIPFFEASQKLIEDFGQPAVLSIANSEREGH